MCECVALTQSVERGLGRKKWMWTKRKVGALKRALSWVLGDLGSRPVHHSNLCVTLCVHLSITDPPSALQSSKKHGARTPTDSYDILGSKICIHSPNIPWVSIRYQALGVKSYAEMAIGLQIDLANLLLQLCLCYSMPQKHSPHFVQLESLLILQKPNWLRITSFVMMPIIVIVLITLD